MARKLVENNSWAITPEQKCWAKKEKNQSCSKLPEMARKLAGNFFGGNPNHKNEFWAKNQKNQSCSKLPERARLLVSLGKPCTILVSSKGNLGHLNVHTEMFESRGPLFNSSSLSNPSLPSSA